MRLRTARVGAVLFFVLFLLAVTWPGMMPFNRIRPLVLGLPFNLFWIGCWVSAGVVVLWALHAVEGGRRDDNRGGRP